MPFMYNYLPHGKCRKKLPLSSKEKVTKQNGFWAILRTRTLKEAKNVEISICTLCEVHISIVHTVFKTDDN